MANFEKKYKNLVQLITLLNATFHNRTTQFKFFNKFEFPAKAKISILKKPLVILTSSSSLQASDLFWPDICGDLIKIRHGELQSERDQVIFF